MRIDGTLIPTTRQLRRPPLGGLDDPGLDEPGGRRVRTATTRARAGARARPRASRSDRHGPGRSHYRVDTYVNYVNNDATLSIRTPASGLTLKRVTDRRPRRDDRTRSSLASRPPSRAVTRRDRLKRPSAGADRRNVTYDLRARPLARLPVPLRRRGGRRRCSCSSGHASRATRPRVREAGGHGSRRTRRRRPRAPSAQPAEAESRSPKAVAPRDQLPARDPQRARGRPAWSSSRSTTRRAKIDGTAMREARAGAEQAGSSFVPVDVRKDDVESLNAMYGVLQDPAVLVLRPPGSLVVADRRLRRPRDGRAGGPERGVLMRFGRNHAAPAEEPTGTSPGRSRPTGSRPRTEHGGARAVRPLRPQGRQAGRDCCARSTRAGSCVVEAEVHPHGREPAGPRPARTRSPTRTRPARSSRRPSRR